MIYYRSITFLILCNNPRAGRIMAPREYRLNDWFWNTIKARKAGEMLLRRL
jgi:hypothetical protein